MLSPAPGQKGYRQAGPSRRVRVWGVAALCLGLAVASAGCLGSGGLFGGVGPRDYLSDRDYSTWIIEVDSVEGQAPSGSTLEFLRSRLQEVANKPGGIEIRQSDTLAARGGTWSSRDVLDIDESSQDVRTAGDTVVTHLLFLDGEYDTANVLGVAIGHSTIAMFSETIRESCSVLTGCLTGVESIFRAVLVHEFGHAMGLVNNGIPMVADHEADECDGRADSGHSTNQNSVMFCAVETANVVNVFQNGPPTTFDAADRQDMCNAGGRC